MVAPMVVDGAINGELFLAYVEQQLVPTLVAGDVVIMDNLSSHERPKVREAIERAGCRLPAAAVQPLSLPTIQAFGSEVGRRVGPAHHQLGLVPAAPDRDPTRLPVVLPPQEATELGQLPVETPRCQRGRPA